jgi:hypothetical protein
LAATVISLAILEKTGAALFILATLAVLDIGPFGMSGHDLPRGVA